MKLRDILCSLPSGVARASAPASVGEAIPTDAEVILGIALDIGAEILRCGGEIYRVEDTIARVCRAYGAEEVQAFAITSLIIADIRMPGGEKATATRRVRSTYNHLSRLEACNALSRAICRQPVSAREVSDRLAAIRRYRPVPEWLCIAGGTISTGGFAMFFGGTWLDGFAAMVIGFFLTLLTRLRPLRIAAVLRSFLSSFAGGVFAMLFVAMGFGDNVDKIIIGTIMLEIPGLSFGNSLRDLLCGDTLAGTMRLIQAVIQALVIAMGYMAALVLFDGRLGGLL